MNNTIASLCNLCKQYTTGAVVIDHCSPSLPIVYHNDAFAALIELEEDSFIGKNLTLLQGEKTDVEQSTDFYMHMLNKIGASATLLNYTTKGNSFWNHMIAHPIENEHGDILYTLVTCEDQSDLLLNKMLAKLEREVYAELEFDDDLHRTLQIITNQVEKYYIRKVFCTIQLIESFNRIAIYGHGSMPIELAASYCPNDPTLFNLTDPIYIQHFSQPYDYTKQVDTIVTSWTMPIASQLKIDGLVTFFFNQHIDMRASDKDFLARLTQLISLTLKYGNQKKQLKKLAYYDKSSNYPNVHYFKKTLEHWISDEKQGVVCILQPGEYSSIVDLYGRTSGDVLIKQMMDRLKNLMDGKQFIARFSNSSAIFANETKYYETANIDWIIKPLTEKPYIIGDAEMYITLKMGIGYFSKNKNAEDCIRHADFALSQSRTTSGTNAAIFEKENDYELHKQLDTLNQLNYGLQNDEFFIYLQPKINFATWEIEGFEALSRWHSKKLGLVSPAKFIPIAEQAGKVKEIDCIVIEQVLSWIQSRLKANLKVVPIAVNISPDHFYQIDFIPDFLELLYKYDVPAKYIKIEVTESMELVNFREAKKILHILNENGIECAIDDFGVGYSSLSYLPKLPFKEIKIDRSFINAIEEPGVKAVIHTIVQLAKNLNMVAVAEGIETVEQFQLLNEMGCPIGQGYFFYKPLPLEEAAALIT